MKIAKDKVVSLTYTLTVNGKEIESVKAEKPLQFIFGAGMLLPKFEENVIGKEIGDAFEFQLVAKDAYGEMNPKAIVDLPMSIFEREGKVDYEIIKEGNMLPMQDADGNRLNGIIKEVKALEKKVVMDFNHPLAGQDLNFKGKVEAVRDAKPEELTNGLYNENAPHECSGDNCSSDDCSSCGCNCH